MSNESPAEREASEARFRRYLLGELLWELDQHPAACAELRRAAPGDLEVIGCRGYHDLQVRAGSEEYDVWLSWQLLVPPRVV
ncbi:MAG: hypothetical protein K0Q72_1920 [Armatimonadetes bacterium]|jgi:hypothetical protein|nr:hypothetical protein [Armatimonadota bacterium]